MIDVSTFESNLRITFEPNPEMSPETIQTAISNINTFCNSPEGLAFLTINLPQFLYIPAKKMSFIVIKNWILYKWDSIPNEIQLSIKQILFTYVIENFESITEDIQNIVCNVQSSFIWRTYPNLWPTFWAELFQSASPIFILHFLYSFCIFSTSIKTDTDKVFSQIKIAIRSQGFDIPILQFLFSSVNQENDLPLKSLSYFIHWMSLDIILKEESLSLILECVRKPNTSAAALDCLTSLIDRGMDEVLKCQIIDSLQIAAQVRSICCSNANNEILYSAARLIEVTGTFLINTEQCLPYYHIALLLLNNDDYKISACVTTFIQQFTKKYPDNSFNVLTNALARLKEFYEKMYTSDDIDFTYSSENEAYRELLFGIIRTCFVVDFEESLQSIVSKCQDIDIIEEMPYCIALLEILNDQSPQPEFVQYFEPILSMVPPLSPVQLKALSCFYRYFCNVANSFDASTISHFFVRIAQFALSPLIKDEARSILSNSLLAFCKKIENVQFDPSIILAFIQTTDPNLISLSAVLNSRLPNDISFELFQQCIKHLLSMLQENGEYCPLVLNFIKAMHYVQGAPHLPIARDFLNKLQPFVVANDGLQALFIKACFSSLGPESSAQITNCVSTSTGRLSISALCEVITAIIALHKDEKNVSIASRFLVHLFQPFVTCFNEIDNWSIVNDDVNEIINMVDNYLLLVHNVLTSLSSDFLSELFQFIISILNSGSKYFCHELYLKIYSFLCHISKLIPKETLEYFGGISIKALIANSDFKPTLPGWGKVILKLVKMNSTLFLSFPTEAATIFGQEFEKENATVQIIQSYFALLNMPPRNRKDESISFFIDLMKYKKSLE